MTIFLPGGLCWISFLGLLLKHQLSEFSSSSLPFPPLPPWAYTYLLSSPSIVPWVPYALVIKLPFIELFMLGQSIVVGIPHNFFMKNVAISISHVSSGLVWSICSPKGTKRIGGAGIQTLSAKAPSYTSWKLHLHILQSQFVRWNYIEHLSPSLFRNLNFELKL